MNFKFFLTAFLLGIGLAMDAFSVSIANSLNEPKMKPPRMCLIAGVFGLFQAVMPITGWVCVSEIANLFKEFQKFIPWIALLLLLYIGGKMLIEGIKNEEEDEKAAVGFGALLVQGVATSIDALSVGFTIADYRLSEAITASVIIAVVTFGICMGGLVIGKTVGRKLNGRASILGGIILIGIGIWNFISNWSVAMSIFG